jgi:hypothetical protein
MCAACLNEYQRRDFLVKGIFGRVKPDTQLSVVHREVLVRIRATSVGQDAAKAGNLALRGHATPATEVGP